MTNFVPIFLDLDVCKFSNISALFQKFDSWKICRFACYSIRRNILPVRWKLFAHENYRTTSNSKIVKLLENVLVDLPLYYTRSRWQHMRQLIRDKKNRSMTLKHKADTDSTRKSRGNSSLLLDFFRAWYLHPSSPLAYSIPTPLLANLFSFYYTESTECILQFYQRTRKQSLRWIL